MPDRRTARMVRALPVQGAAVPGVRCLVGLDCEQPEAALRHTHAFIRGGCHTLHAPSGVSGRVRAVGRKLAAVGLGVEGGEPCGEDWCCGMVRAEGEPQTGGQLVPCRLLEDVRLEGGVAASRHALQQRQLGGAAWVHLQPHQDVSEHDCIVWDPCGVALMLFGNLCPQTQQSLAKCHNTPL